MRKEKKRKKNKMSVAFLCGGPGTLKPVLSLCALRGEGGFYYY
jgi:hypothetical protein